MPWQQPFAQFDALHVATVMQAPLVQVPDAQGAQAWALRPHALLFC